MMGTAFEMKRMPAVTFRKSIAHSAQNCGVRSAREGGYSSEATGAVVVVVDVVVDVDVDGFRRSDAQSPPTTA
jgi:hypothetical protein